MDSVKVNRPYTFQLFLTDSAGAKIAQTAPFPKITIRRVSGTPAVIVNAATMTQDVAGRYIYAWTPPAVGQYSAEYEYEYLSVSRFANDEIDVQSDLIQQGSELVGTVEEN